MENKKYKKSGFTLVELIVVVTILAILSTIGFVSYSGYLTGVRDTNRLASLTAISDGLELYRTKNDLPTPDDSVEVQVNGTTIARQGYVGKNVLQTIEYSKSGKDPKDANYYSYYLTDDNKYYQLMAFLEESENLDTRQSLELGNQAYAVTDYSKRHPKVYGKRLGILTDTDNTPIQDLPAITSSGYLDITSSLSQEYIARFEDSDIITASGVALSTISPNSSCKRIKTLNGGSQDGIYEINPTGISAFKVYCDMTTDGGGWTFTTMLADSTTFNLFDTGNSNKITSLTADISTKGNISDFWLDNENKDILLQCMVDADSHKGYEVPFIIYDYLKSDLSHLTKTVKSDTVFSSTQLTAKWKNHSMLVGTQYGDAGHANGMYLLDASSGNRIFVLKNVLGVNSTGYEQNSPAYYTSSVFNPITTSNYCMSAIR